MRYWIFLALAIVSEITGTLFMKWGSNSQANYGFLLMLLLITLSYIFLAFAIRKIALGVAYALWEGCGLLLITLFSLLLFNESFSLLRIGGLVILVAGMTLIKYGICQPPLKKPREKTHATV